MQGYCSANLNLWVFCRPCCHRRYGFLTSPLVTEECSRHHGPFLFAGNSTCFSSAITKSQNFILAPADFPQNVRKINKTSSSILIAWDAVLTNSSNQQNYKVAYIRFKRLTGAAIKTIQVSTVYANLTGLVQNTRYNITVLACNEHGDGPSSEVVVLRTDQGSKISSLCLLFQQSGFPRVLFTYVYPNIVTVTNKILKQLTNPFF